MQIQNGVMTTGPIIERGALFFPAPSTPKCQCGHKVHTGRQCNAPMCDAMGDGGGTFCRCPNPPYNSRGDA